MDLESKYCYFYHSWGFVPYLTFLHLILIFSCTLIFVLYPFLVILSLFFFLIVAILATLLINVRVVTIENRMRSNLELLPVINVKSRPRYISALKKSRLRYISAQKISTLFWCTEWASWNRQIIFRFASIHGRACLNRWKEHPYIVLQYTPKSTQKFIFSFIFFFFLFFFFLFFFFFLIVFDK
jgi:hypothetical protein